MSENRLALLFHRYFDQTATDAEIDELMGLLRQAGNDEQMQRLIASAWNRLEAGQNFFTQGQSDKILRNILHGELPDAGMAAKTLRRPPWFGLFKAAAVAALIFLLGTPIYLLIKHQPQKQPVAIEKKLPPAAPDLPPGSSKAILTLADGSTITLDSLPNGNLARQGNTKITKSGSGQLIYALVDNDHAVPVNNSISTPVGGQYQVVLSDGSKVWLNAASSLRFPTTFDGKHRDVEITGEVYFEVKENAAMPFRVKVGNAVVGVLGTNFNIMAYSDEHAVRTTLLRGAVKVSRGNQSLVLRPGQEAAFNEGESVISVKEADTDEAVAWKNGLFEFNSADIKTIMRQLGRWYDVEIKYETRVPDWHFTGTIRRNIPLSQVIKMLEVNDFHFRVDGKQIIVL